MHQRRPWAATHAHAALISHRGRAAGPDGRVRALGGHADQRLRSQRGCPQNLDGLVQKAQSRRRSDFRQARQLRRVHGGGRLPCVSDQPTVRMPLGMGLPGKRSSRLGIPASRIVSKIRQSVHETIQEETFQSDRFKSGNYTSLRAPVRVRRPPPLTASSMAGTSSGPSAYTRAVPTLRPRVPAKRNRQPLRRP